MLMLTMDERGDEIVVVLPDGRRAEIKCVEIRRDKNKVRLGLTFPDDVKLYRKKVMEAIDAEDKRRELLRRGA